MHDIGAMKTFDKIEVQRPGIAQSYLALLDVQAGRPLPVSPLVFRPAH